MHGGDLLRGGVDVALHFPGVVLHGFGGLLLVAVRAQGDAVALLLKYLCVIVDGFSME
jgi:hypothetical protein